MGLLQIDYHVEKNIAKLHVLAPTYWGSWWDRALKTMGEIIEIRGDWTVISLQGDKDAGELLNEIYDYICGQGTPVLFGLTTRRILIHHLATYWQKIITGHGKRKIYLSEYWTSEYVTYKSEMSEGDARVFVNEIRDSGALLGYRLVDDLNAKEIIIRKG